MTTAPPEPALDAVTYGEAEEILQCSRRTLFRLINDGEIPVIRPPGGRRAGLIERRELYEYVERERTAARRKATRRKKSAARSRCT